MSGTAAGRYTATDSSITSNALASYGRTLDISSELTAIGMLQTNTSVHAKLRVSNRPVDVASPHP
jgi:hypothetical protein